MPQPGTVAVRYRFDRYLLEPERHALSAGGVAVTLSSRGFDILCLLVERHGRVVAKDELMAAVWPGLLVEENNLAVQVSGLRRSLGEQHDGQPFIATVPGRGYRFVAAVEAVGEDRAPSPPVHRQAALAPTPARLRVPPAWLLLPLLSLPLLSAGAWFGLTGHHVPPRLSIVVLPFRNLGSDPAQDYLADAISDDLTTDLAHLPGSRVIARESADTYKGHPARAELIGRALDVRYLLEGSLRRDGDLLHINAQLIDARDASHLWASGFDVAPEALGHARVEIVRHLAAALDVTLVQVEAARSLHERPHDPDSVDLYLRARSVLDRDDSLDGLASAQHLLDRAVAAAPDFADAQAQLGLVLLRKIGGFDDPDEWQDHAAAARAVAQAVATAPRDPLAITARGMLEKQDKHCAEALPDFRLALSLDPDLLQARAGIASCAHALGRMQEMIDTLQEILRIDPAGAEGPRRENLIGLGYLLLSRPAEASPWLDRAHAAAAGGGALGWQEWNALYRIAAAAETNDLPQARALYAHYIRQWPRRTVWRLSAYHTRALASLPGFAPYLAALRSAGMPMQADEAEDFGVVAGTVPRSGDDFAATPLSLPGGTRIDTRSLAALLRQPNKPRILDVGRGAAVIPVATLVWPRGAVGDGRALLEGAAGPHDVQSAPVVVMGDGPSGWRSYNAALQLISVGVSPVLWYRGGEEAWMASGSSTEDRRAE